MKWVKNKHDPDPNKNGKPEDNETRRRTDAIWNEFLHQEMSHPETIIIPTGHHIFENNNSLDDDLTLFVPYAVHEPTNTFSFVDELYKVDEPQTMKQRKKLHKLLAWGHH